jgi:hypothetical protein
VPGLRPRNGKQRQERASATAVTKNQFQVADATSIGVLKAGARTVRHHKLGWLKEDLLASGELDGTKDALHAKIWAGNTAQKFYIRAQQDIMGDDLNPLDTVPGRDHEGKFAFHKLVDVLKNHLGLAYLLHAYDVNTSTFKRLRMRGGAALEKQVPHKKGQSVLLHKDYAVTIYNARYFFIKNQMRKWLQSNAQASTKRKAEGRTWLRKKWDTEEEKDVDFGAGYEKKNRDHAKRQEGAKVELVDTLNRDGRRSYASLEKALNNWCCWKTIKRFFISTDDFTTYSQNIRPLLSEGNRLKQVNFSKHVHNRWGHMR